MGIYWILSIMDLGPGLDGFDGCSRLWTWARRNVGCFEICSKSFNQYIISHRNKDPFQ
jgi:hypothetical protein